MGNCCNGNGVFKNTGVPTSRNKGIDDPYGFIICRMVADDGTPNQILASDTINQAYLDARTNHEDYSKRWFWVQKLKDVADVRAEYSNVSRSDNSTSNTVQGVRTFTGSLTAMSNAYQNKLDSFSCGGDFGIYSLGDCSDLTGSKSADCTALNPVKVNDESWYTLLTKKSDADNGNVMLKFEYDQREKDGNLAVIFQDEMTSGVDVLNETGLIDVKITTNTITATGFVAVLKVDFDKFSDATQIDVVGLLLASFDLYNTTTGLSIVISSVTEAPDGTYTFVIPANAAAILRLRPLASDDNGYWFEELITTP